MAIEHGSFTDVLLIKNLKARLVYWMVLGNMAFYDVSGLSHSPQHKWITIPLLAAVALRL